MFFTLFGCRGGGGGGSPRAWGTTCLCSLPASAAQKWLFLSPLRGADRGVRAVEAPYGPMGAYGEGLWGPIGPYGDLWWPMGTFGDPLEPMGTYRGLWGGGHQLFAHPFGHQPPPPLSSKHQIYIRHITHLVVYTAKTTCHIRHQTLYTIFPWPRQNSFLGPDFVSSANGSM